MKSLSGANLAGYMKENQAHMVQSLKSCKIQPKLIIIRNSNNPVITKYVQLKIRYGEDIGIIVEDWLREDIDVAIHEANRDESTHGIIVQLPLEGEHDAVTLVNQITPEKDVDGLGEKAQFDSATATAINWLLAGYNIDLENRSIALVGRGKLVGKPLEKMWKNSGYNVTTFGRNSDLNELKTYDVIISATGVPHLIRPEMVKAGAVIVDAGTASEDGVLVGDVAEEVRSSSDITAITPKLGGVGPLTISALFEHVLIAAQNAKR